ncbi:hypothetical protein [Nonomuraea basaltis]|uniref:hypothetical protein n=1 Tax=Nonomuraea basaltis TaxID=2495887 RepID=UPI00110C6FA3|nr:hypothetical protein [Nonomuraea basaltis]TMR92557.1 hypothetical protein EJK15_43935 [Nonomuraea basaltis]
MSNNPLTVFRLDVMTFIVGEVTARTRREARAKLRDVVESLDLASDDPDVTLDGLSIDGDIDVIDETPIAAPDAPAAGHDADPGAAGPRLYDGLDIFLPQP